MKLRSFTLLELLVTFLISAIVLTLAMYTLNSFKKITFVFGLQQQTLHRVATLHRLLTQDFSQCEKLIRTRNGITAHFPKRNIEYHFTRDEYIMRKQSKIEEEFPFFADEMHVKYAGKPVFLTTDLIDELSFEIEIEGEYLPFHFYKVYAADILMENENK